jgi:hypothetical protein
MVFQSPPLGPEPKTIDLGATPPGIVYFNGSSDEIQRHHSQDFNPASFTVEVWVEFHGGLGYRALLTSVSGSAAEGRRGYLFCVSASGHWQFWLGGGQKNAPWVTLSGPTAPAKTWTHLVGTYDRASRTAVFYVNGAIAARLNDVDFQPNDRHPLHVGAGATHQAGANPCFFHGRIARVRIWKRSLAETEVETLSRSRTPEAPPTDSAPSGSIPEPDGDRPPAVLQSVLAFDGIDDRLEIAYPFKNNTTFTLSLWVKPSQLDDGWRLLFGEAGDERGDDTPHGPGLWIAPRERGLYYDSFRADGSARHAGSLDGFFPTGDRWVQIAWVKDGSEYRFYRNGERFATETAPENFYGHPQILYNIGGNDTFFRGAIAHLSLWTVALNPNEIRECVTRPPHGDEPGLCYYWPLDEGSGAIAHNRARRHNPATIYGATWGESDLAIAADDSDEKPLQTVLCFDGQDDYLEIDDPFDNPENFTISLWVKPVLDRSGYSYLMGKRWWASALKPELFIAKRIKSLLSYSSAVRGDSPGETLDECRPQAVILSNFFDGLEQRWVHIAWVKDGNEYRYYRNGELVRTQPAPERIYTEKTTYWFGKIGGGQPLEPPNIGYFEGQMSEIRIWSVPRSEAEIRGDRERRLSGNEPGLAYYWPLNDGGGDRADDRANPPNDAKIIGASWQQSESPIAEPRPGKIAPLEVESEIKNEIQAAVSLDGEDDAIAIDNPFQDDRQFTIALWLKPSAIDDETWHGILGDRRYGDRCQPGLSLCPYDGTLLYHARAAESQSARSDLLCNFLETGDLWVHLTWVKDGSEYRFYRNGEPFASRRAPERVYIQGSVYYLGKVAISETLDTFFSGQLADVRFWSVPRTDAEIRADLHRRLRGNEPGLSYYWPLNEGRGTAIGDRGPQRSRGELCGATWQQLPIPIASAIAPAKALNQWVLRFDGRDDYLAVPDCPGLQVEAYTVELWLNADGKPEEAETGIVGKPGRNFNVWLHDNGAIAHRFHNGAATDAGIPDTPPGAIAWNQWHHVAITNDGTTAKTYIDGQLMAEGSSDEPLIVDRTPLYIGRHLDGEPRGYFNGQMSDIRIWNRARTAVEIEAEMSSRLTGEEDGLIAYWPLDEGSGVLLRDRTGRSAFAQAIGGTWEEVELPIV